MATVVNKRTHRPQEDDVYIGRPSRWGNPFVIGRGADREFVIEKFRQWLWNEIKSGHISLEELAELQHKTLVCWCSPAPCHGDVLARAADWAAEQLAREDTP